MPGFLKPSTLYFLPTYFLLLIANTHGEAGTDEFFTNKPYHGLLSQYFFFHHHVASVEEFSFMPKSTVRQMAFACSRTDCKLLSKSFVVSSSLISSGLGGFSFWIWHNLCVYFNFFNFSHRGSIFSSSF
jgi:hypothetical protein